jgi:hypothetical protein
VFFIGVHPRSFLHPLGSPWKDYEMRKGFTRKPQADAPTPQIKNYITPSGLERLKDDHRFLVHHSGGEVSGAGKYRTVSSAEKIEVWAVQGSMASAAGETARRDFGWIFGLVL